MLRSFNATFRFLLECMYYPNFIGDLNRINHTEGVALEWQCNLEHSRPNTSHWLSNISLTAFGSDCQSRKTD